MYKYLFSLLLFATMYSCTCSGGKSTAEDDNTVAQQPAKLIRFDKELFAVKPDSIAVQLPVLTQRYGTFFTLYSTGIIGLTAPTEPEFATQLQAFLTNSVVKDAHAKVVDAFSDTRELNSTLQEGFANYAKQYEGKQIPKIYAYISGFNQPLMLTDSAVGVSLDMFLGRACSLYNELNFPKYQQKNMYKERIPVEVMKAWAIGEYPWDDLEKPLLASMIREGKLMYFVKTMLPKVTDTCLTGYTKNELQWCLDNERDVWVVLVENKLLFDAPYGTIKRMIDDAPFTANLLADAPGRTCCWVGYRVVERYMKYSKATLPELMADEDYRKILEQAKYNP